MPSPVRGGHGSAKATSLRPRCKRPFVVLATLDQLSRLRAMLRVLRQRWAPADRAAPTVADAAEGILRLENLPLPLAVLHRDGRVITANQALRRLLGYGLTELVNRPIWDFHADPDMGRATFGELLEHGLLPERELLYRRGDGRTVATTCTAIVTRGEPGVLVTVSPRP